MAGCNNLIEAVLPNKVVTIGEGALQSCSELKRVEFPPTLKNIRKYAFAYCRSLEQINLPGVETIEEWAFVDCNNIKSIRIPSTLR